MVTQAHVLLNLRHAVLKILLMILLVPLPAFAGDDASGDIPREMDLSVSYSVYKIQERDRKWSANIVKNLGYKGKVIHFVKTSIPLLSNGKVVEGRIYQNLEKPDIFYVAEGDLMFIIGQPHPFSPGVSGFSMHASKSKNFIVCLNCLGGGGVLVRASTKVTRGKNSWQGLEWNRF